jgi:putative hemolysin
MNDYVTEIVIIIGLIILNGFFAAAEIALVTARRHALEIAAEEGATGARKAVGLIDDPSRFLAAIQVGITLAGFMASATAAVSLAGLLQGWLEALDIGWSDGVAAGVSVFIVTLAISYLMLVFGELAPKRLGLHRAEAIAAHVAGPVSFLAWITGPVTWVLSRSSEAVARLLGVRGDGSRTSVTEEEIKLLVAEQVELMDEEKRMIHEIFELGDTVAREIMVPRVDAVMVERDATIREALGLFAESGFSRLPVYAEDPDKVVGILLLKDLLPAVSEGHDREPVGTYMRETTFAPETKQVLALMKEMQAARNALVVVVDEYGGTAGLLTLEDIIEEVVGEIVDEYDREERYITELGPGDWIVDGRCAVEDAAETLGMDFPESEEYETVAGWMLVRLGHIPIPGEWIEHDGATIRVQTVRRRRIARLRITREETDGATAVSE